MQNMPIGIFRGDDTDAFGYQTIVGTINTDLDLTGCKAVFRYLGFSMEFDPIPEDKKLTIIIPADETKNFPPGLGYASLRVYDSEGRLKTFSNRIMVFVATKTPMFGNEEFEVDFNVRPELEPLKIFVGPNPNDFDEYRGFIEKVIDRASAEKYGLTILLDAIDSDLGAEDGVAATPVSVKAAYAAIIEELTNNYYTATETDEAIDRVAAYYITYTAAGAAFPTYAALENAQTVYSGGEVRIPTRNDYCVVLADETHGGSEYRYIYAVADGETTGQWQPQFPVEGVMTVDQTVQKNSQNPVSGGGVWSAIWGALSALPTGFTSLYDWVVAQLAGKASKSDLDPLLFARYYPDGSVKSAAEFTDGIKYDAPDTVNRTITVKPFCNTGDSEDDNSGLAGRVVIPPFVDERGNPYISDDGTRFKVVGVGEGSPSEYNTNPIAIVAPNTVTTIGAGAFNRCTLLASISLPAATSIGDGAFTECTSLASVSLPVAEDIGNGAFSPCTSLAIVSFPAVTGIGGGAFEYCTSLASIDFGATPRASVPSLGLFAFEGVPDTCKIIVPEEQFNDWTAATLPGGSPNPWYALVTAGYKFLKHSEWEYARKYEVDEKADKPATFTTGNLAKFDSNGNPTDSGKKPSDFQSALTAQQLSNIAAVSDALAFDATHTYAAGDPVVYDGTLYTFTAAHTGTWTGIDVSAVDIIARLAGKLDKSGGTMTGDLEGTNISVVDASGGFLKLAGEAAGTYFYYRNGWHGADSPVYQIVLPDANGTLALAAPNPTAGNLAALDANGNPTDALIPAANVAVKGNIPYDLVTKTISNNAVSLDDRATNDVAINSTLSPNTLTVNFPTATTGKARDFAMRLDLASGVTAPEIAWPQGVTLENDGGEVSEIADGGTDGSSTILYFSETATNKFLVKGETLTAIAQA